jgi:hypothetical protein
MRVIPSFPQSGLPVQQAEEAADEILALGKDQKTEAHLAQH